MSIYIVRNSSGAEFEVTKEHYDYLKTKPEYDCAILGAGQVGKTIQFTHPEPKPGVDEVSTEPIKEPVKVNTAPPKKVPAKKK